MIRKAQDLLNLTRKADFLGSLAFLQGEVSFLICYRSRQWFQLIKI